MLFTQELQVAVLENEITDNISPVTMQVVQLYENHLVHYSVIQKSQGTKTPVVGKQSSRK